MEGRTLSHYKVLEELSRGGMGIVYRAFDLKLKREVALKVLPPELVSDRERKRRFIQEAQAAAALKHPNIAVVYEVDEVEDETFIAMELIEGEKLSETIKRGPLPIGRSLRLAREIAEGLRKAHEKHIVHRDLKPANIMVTEDGHPKIIDFGLAKLIEPVGEGGSLVETAIRGDTAAGAVVGTVGYMSPEQARGQSVDHRSDIFSFGTVLFEMVTGRHPFQSGTYADTVSAILNQEPPQPKPPLPRSVQVILNRCLKKDPALRFQNASDLVRALEDAEDMLRQRHSRAAGLVAAVALVGLLLAGTWWMARQDGLSKGVIDAPLSVLVADFDNRTGELVFEGAVEQALAISLEGAPFITAYDRARARRQSTSLSPGTDGKLNETTARLLCQSQGIELAVVGRIENDGEAYRVEASALDPVTGKPLAEASEAIPDKTRVLRAVDRLASDLRGDLGDVDPTSRLAFAKETFTTASLEAMHAYAAGQDLLSSGRFEAAIREYGKAIRLDPEFGRALVGIGVALTNLDRRQEAYPYLEEALSLIHRMTDRERLRTRGVYYLLKRNFKQAADEYGQLVDAFPSDGAGFANLALSHFYSRNFDTALEMGQRAAVMDPRALSRTNAAIYATYAGDFAQAIRQAEAVVAESPNYEEAYVALAQARLAKGDLEGAREAYRRLQSLEERGPSLSVIGLADIALYEGKLDEADTLLRPAASSDPERNDAFAAAQKLVMLAEVDVLRATVGAAVDSAERALSLLSRDVGIRFRAAWIQLHAGNQERALELAAVLATENDAESKALANLVRAEAALAAGDADRAIEMLTDAQEIADTWLGRFALGRAYLEINAFAQANSELDTCLRRRGEATALFLDDVPTFRVVPDVYYYLGISQEGLGSPGAAESYRKFLRIKEGGDETPLTSDAKRRLGLEE